MLRTLLLLTLLALAGPAAHADAPQAATPPEDAFNDAPGETAAPSNDAPTDAALPDFQAREDPGVVVLDDPDTGGPTPTNQVPIDGGLGWLAAAGAGYAIRTLRNRRAARVGSKAAGKPTT